MLGGREVSTESSSGQGVKMHGRSYQVRFAGRKSLHWEENEEEDETETGKAFGGAGLCKSRRGVRSD
jgi:hypothetical protein